MMIKTIRTKTYNTENASIVKKVTHGYWGDPAGYEKTLFRTPDGEFFLYTFGGSASAFAKESIVALTKVKADEWIKNN